MIKKLLLVLLLVVTNSGHANALDQCFNQAGQRYNISPMLLKAIGKVESNYNPRAENVKTKARGVMQIHPWWFARIEKLGVDPEALWDGCTNILWGTWILAQEIVRYGNSWTAVGAYGAGGYNENNQEEREQQYKIYARKVQAKLEWLQKQESKGTTAGNTTQKTKPARQTVKTNAGNANRLVKTEAQQKEKGTSEEGDL